MTNRKIPRQLLTEEAINRFRTLVSYVGHGSCWIWKGEKLVNREYGLFRLQGHRYLAHRVSFLIHNGIFNPIKVIRHTCDNPPCVNPAHLKIGTQRDNVMDAVKKLRMQHGETHCRAKLTTKEVMEIQKLLKRGHQQKAIAEMFGVNKSTICCINIKRNWKHVN